MNENQTHLKQVHKALKFIATELNNQKIDWLLGASGGLMVWGIEIVPHDLDIFTSTDNFEKMFKLFSDYTIQPIHREETKDYLKFEMEINGINIEIIELSFGFNIEDQVKIDFEGTKIPVNTLEKELQFYKGREGKEKVVDLIEKHLQEMQKI